MLQTLLPKPEIHKLHNLSQVFLNSCVVLDYSERDNQDLHGIVITARYHSYTYYEGLNI